MSGQAAKDARTHNKQSPAGDAQCHVTLLLARAEKAEARIAELEHQNAQMFNTICVERNTVADRDRQIAALREAMERANDLLCSDCGPQAIEVLDIALQQDKPVQP
jgi:uncharacterized coiled-coil protein SlyX